MLHRVLAVTLCAIFQPASLVAPRPLPPPQACLAGVRGANRNGDQMTSGMPYSTALPVVAHRTLELGTLVVVRFGGRTVEGIVLDNLVTDRRLDAEISPLLSRRLAVLPDKAEPVTIEVVGHAPRSRWIHAIGARTP